MTEVQQGNGKNMVLISSPQVLSTDAFVGKAKRSKWIQQSVPTSSMRIGAVPYLASTFPDDTLAGLQLDSELQLRQPPVIPASSYLNRSLLC